MRRFETSRVRRSGPPSPNDPALYITQPGPEQGAATFPRSLRIVIARSGSLAFDCRSVAHALDVGGFGIRRLCSTWRPFYCGCWGYCLGGPRIR